MSRLISIAAIMAAALGLILAASCAREGNPAAPRDLTSPQVFSATCLGEWTLVPTKDMTSAIIEPVRTPQFDVTKWAQVKIMDAVWDPLYRTWTVTVRVTNPTNLSGWGGQAIFTELGQKELRWPDGFRWMDLDGNPGLERYPFFAIEKTTPDRIFEGQHYVTQDLTFYFPEGVDKWKPISFILDAWLTGPRPDPMVEDLDMAYFPPPCYHATVTVHVRDHQSSSDQLDVWLDLSPLGGNDHEPMLDDGNHDDGVAGDGIFGAEFTGGMFGELYTLTVHASDPESNTSENDILYSPIEYPPLPPIHFENLLSGQQCKLTEQHLEVIEDEASWEAFWAEFDPGIPMLTVDFSINRVIAVCLGNRPDDCYSVEITNVDWSSENCGWAAYYTETVPGPDCICNDIVTSPYHLITVGNAAFNVMFKGDTYEDPCGGPQDPCVDLYPVTSGTHGLNQEKSMTVIVDQQGWDTWWKENVGSGDPPSIDFGKQILFAVTMGWQSSSGFSPSIDSACLDDTDMMEITVGWHIPGPDCITMPVITEPYVVVSTNKVAYPFYWTTYDDIYSC